jgi:predicted RNA-binding protein with PUA-like domain
MSEERYWLMKAEPDEYSIDDLRRDRVHFWDGVRGYQARNYMRDEMKKGDLVIFYHSSAKEIGAAGVAKVATPPYPDHTQFDPKSRYYDPKSKKDSPTWIMVDVRFVKRFPRIVTREEMRNTSLLKDMPLWKNVRLSIMPFTKKEFTAILSLGERAKKRG